MNQLQQKVHKVMKYLANPLANGRLELLESYCRVVGIDFLRPVLEIDIRWNSTLASRARAIQWPSVKPEPIHEGARTFLSAR